MRFMNLQYVKRFRMELDLGRWKRPRIELPTEYRLVAWHTTLVQAHAEVKYASFRGEIDAQVFPCLGELDGCAKLMSEIEAKDGFLPEGTWLAENVGMGPSAAEYCGTIQAVRTQKGKANIQNIGVVPYHRGRGIGTALILASLLGLHYQGIRRVGLEVTADNENAVRLYRQLGFRTVRTLYKAVELAYSEAAR
ncbi:MAG: GNAT family N-acetyltransferase [Bythopirellula sp.]